MPNKLQTMAAVGAAVLAMSATQALAEYPDRPVTVVVPFSAGGNTDTIARIAAEHLAKELGQPVIVENRGGGGGTIGAELVSKAEPDGYTLLFATTGSHSVNPNLREVGYDPIKDFTPISTGVVSSVLIVVNPDVQAENLEELVALTSSEEGKTMNFGSGGVGTVAHVAGELYNQRTGSEMVHIPYRGAGDVMNDLVAGRLQVYMNNVPTFLPHIQAGSVRPLAIAAEKRSRLLPDVPTTGEAGLDDFVLGSWYGLLGPAGLPDDVVETLHAAMVTLDDDPEVVEKYAAIGTEPIPSDSPEAFAAYMADQYAWWGEILKNPVFKE
jgi:tripartite-type tricarboxylate transporter receptor subunit TctC